MHGDHHLGTIKVLHERDKVISKLIKNGSNKDQYKIYLVIPYFMQKWIELGIGKFEHKDLIEIIHLNELNPEPQKHYDVFSTAETR
jgi:hypothetical protein